MAVALRADRRGLTAEANDEEEEAEDGAPDDGEPDDDERA